MATQTSAPIASWADDVDADEAQDDNVLPKPVETVDENGVRTVVEYYINDQGKKVKVTRKTKKVLQKLVVNHAVAERKQWVKFGAERGSKPGPDRATTTVGEAVSLKLTAGNKTNEVEVDASENPLKASMANRKVTCRICQGEHFTAKCPYKDSLGNIAGADTPVEPDVGVEPAAPSGGGIGSKYVPPSMRAGAGRGAGESMFRSGQNRDDLPTLRVTNVSEDTSDNDLRDLFSRFGRVARVYIGRDRETGVGKGYAFVSFEERAVAERAMQKVHGMGYDNLILNCQWSQPRGEGRGA